MSVGLFGYDRDIKISDSKLVLSENISTENFYENIWSKAVKECDSKLFKDDSEFTVQQIDLVIDELRKQLNWCEKNLNVGTHDYVYMHSRIIHIIKILDKERNKEGHPFYIFWELN